MVADIRPEAELLLCCARTRIDSAGVARIRTVLREALDWVYLIQTARSHGIMPLLYWSLNTTCPEAVPRAILDNLKKRFYGNAGRNLLLTDELLSLLNLLEEHEIRAIPFKGPVLSASAYNNLLLREFSDLDILIHKRDVLRAKDLLISQGYRLTLTDAQEAAHFRSHHALTFISENRGVAVDVHWRITAKPFHFPLDPECLWERLEPLSLAGTTVPNLAPEELLLILCAHGSKHMWERLQWICDVAELIRAHQEIEWERVIEQANMLESKRMLFLGLLLARDLLGTTLPENVRQAIQTDPVAKLLAAQVCKNLFRESDPLLRNFKLFFFYLRLTDGWRNRVPYFLYVATANRQDQALLPLPTFLSFLYYFIRPLRLIGKHGFAQLKHLHKIIRELLGSR